MRRKRGRWRRKVGEQGRWKVQPGRGRGWLLTSTRITLPVFLSLNYYHYEYFGLVNPAESQSKYLSTRRLQGQDAQDKIRKSERKFYRLSYLWWREAGQKQESGGIRTTALLRPCVRTPALTTSISPIYIPFSFHYRKSLCGPRIPILL